MEIAQTILEQLGGRQFAVITGSKKFTAMENGLRMSVARNAKGVNMVEVKLEDDDTYTVTAYQRRLDDAKVVGQATLVYCDNLQNIFESLTGLYTTLLPRR